MQGIRAFLGDKEMLGVSLVRAVLIVLRVTGSPLESDRFINNRKAEKFDDPEREICLPVDLSRLTAVTWDTVRDYPRAADICRRDVEKVIWAKKDLDWLFAKMPTAKFADLPN